MIISLILLLLSLATVLHPAQAKPIDPADYDFSLATVLHPAQAKPIDRNSIKPNQIKWALKFEYDVLPPGWGWGSPGWWNRRRQELARRGIILKVLRKLEYLKTSAEKAAEKAIKDHVVEVQFIILISIVGICGIGVLLAIIVCLILVYKQKRKSTDSQTIDV